MIFILEIILFVALFPILYMLIEYLYYRNNKRISEAKGEFTKDNYVAFLSIQRKLEKNKKIKGLFQRKNDKLKKNGYPLKLNAFSYYMIKFLAAVIFILCTISGKLNTALILAVILMMFLPDFMCLSLAKKEKLEILGDLPNINDILNIQSSAAGMNLGTALTEVFDVAKCKRLKENLIQLSIEISLTKNVPLALDHFVENFDMTEIDSFVLAIKQSIKTGRTKELLDSQSELLKDAGISRVNAKTKEISLWIGLVGGLIFLGLAGEMLFSFGYQIYDGLKNLF